MTRRAVALSLLLALAACASAQSDYPSLAIRPQERASGTMQPAAATPVYTPQPSAALDKISQLAANARASHQAFLSRVAGARPAITAGRGAAVGAESWAKAEAALADVRAARSKTMIPLVDLDRLLVDAGTQGQATDRIGAAREEVEALVMVEGRTIAELQANLP